MVVSMKRLKMKYSLHFDLIVLDSDMLWELYVAFKTIKTKQRD